MKNDVFHQKYRKLSEEEQKLKAAIKGAAAGLLEMFEATENPVSSIRCRETAIATEKLEESVMWAIKGLTK